MQDSNALIRTVLVALLVGVTLPLMVQLFVTLRALQKAITSLDLRLGESLGEITQLLKSTRPAPAPAASDAGQWATIIAGAIGPALLAAIRAYRSSHSEPAPSADLETP